MAPHKSRKSKPVCVHPVESGDSEEQSSQDGEFDAVKAAQSIVVKFQNTREASRNALEAEHKKQVKETKDKIDALFNARKQKVTKSRRQLYARLMELNQRRQIIESQIIASMKSIEINSANISHELNAMFTGRIEEIENSNFFA